MFFFLLRSSFLDTFQVCCRKKKNLFFFFQSEEEEKPKKAVVKKLNLNSSFLAKIDRKGPKKGVRKHVQHFKNTMTRCFSYTRFLSLNRSVPTLIYVQNLSFLMRPFFFQRFTTMSTKSEYLKAFFLFC